MSQKIIRAALEGRLKTWADTQTPAIPIAWQNLPFTPPNNARYLRAFLLPAESENIYVDGRSVKYIGVFQVSIVMPNGGGAGAGEQIVSDLEALFAVDQSISKSGLDILMRKPPSSGVAIQESGSFVIPVSIHYMVFKVI